MIGMIIKELLTIWDLYRKNMLLVLVIYAGIGIMTGNTFFCCFLIWMTSFYCLGSITAEQNTGWDNYVHTLPVDPKDVVIGKYAAYLLILLGSTVFSFALCLISFAMGKANMEECLAVMAAFFALSLVSTSIMLPAAWKWGVEKARNGILLLWGAVTVLAIFFGTKSAASADAAIAGLITWLNHNALLFTIILCAVVLAILLASMFISCRVYEGKRKEK